MPSIQLPPAEMNVLRDALLNAFPREEDLQELLRFKLGLYLNHIVASSTYAHKVYELIDWLNSRGRIHELITYAYEANLGNPQLARFHEKVLPRLNDGLKATVPVVLTDEDIAPLLAGVTETDLEVLIFGRQGDTRLPYTFVEQALVTARSIARLLVPRIFNGKMSKGGAYGTGWLIGQGVVITNRHVIEARDPRKEKRASTEDFEEQARNVTVRFDYWDETAGSFLECSKATLLASNEELDYALLKIVETDKVADRRPLTITTSETPLYRGTRLNIVQHPEGGPLKYAMRNNFYVSEGRTPSVIRYQTDTEPGASGSPVCTDAWEVVALHRASTKVTDIQPPQEVITGDPVTVTVLNEAVKIHAILDNIPAEVRESIELEHSREEEQVERLGDQ
jgi:trypsin-like peptidase/effector-associated domain 1 (EAD1)-containing protein